MQPLRSPARPLQDGLGFRGLGFREKFRVWAGAPLSHCEVRAHQRSLGLTMQLDELERQAGQGKTALKGQRARIYSRKGVSQKTHSSPSVRLICESLYGHLT